MDRRIPPPRCSWQPCQAIDVSLGGAGLELFKHPVTVGESLELSLIVNDGESVGIHLRGIVRNTSPTGDDTYRIGLEFANLTPIELSTLVSFDGDASDPGVAIAAPIWRVEHRPWSEHSRRTAC